MPSYLETLTLTLARGFERIAPERRTRHANYLLAHQRPDGGFAGREGQSDLYYTSFAMRALALLGELHGDVATRAAEFLQSKLVGRVPVVDFISLIYGATLLQWAANVDVFAGKPPAWRQATAAAFESLRRNDGGYAKTPEGEASSLYHTFLVVLSQQLLELPLVTPDRLVTFVLSRRRDDGGFVEMAPMKRSGANPTAAAIALLRLLGQLSDAHGQDAKEFLAEMQTDEGGLRANTRIPIADLLSTFTGLVTLRDLSAFQLPPDLAFDIAACKRYVDALERPDGGFHGAAWDNGHDCEYTFYGLGALALLSD